jgi:hypothetical protein
MSKIYQILLSLLIEKGYKLTKDLILSIIEKMKDRKKIKDCLDEKDPLKRSSCVKDELNDKL